jgi:hypothetical protein
MEAAPKKKPVVLGAIDGWAGKAVLTSEANGTTATVEAPFAGPVTTPVVGLSLGDVVARWREEGPLVRVPTGIAPLDELCRGGLPFPWRAMLVGAPSAGKTFLQVAIFRALVDRGIVVGLLGVDEEPDDLVVRLAQIAGFSVADIEQRNPLVLDAIATALERLAVRLYDSTHTIESAAADLARVAGERRLPAALSIDSIQTVRSEAAIVAGADSPRAIVEANVAAVRTVANRYRMLVSATCEANRNSYRSQTAADESNDLAAGAESRAVEFGAQTQLMLRTPKDHPDVIHVRVAKNRRARVGEFWLRIDRERHTLEPCPNPCPRDDGGEERSEKKRAAKVNEVERDARLLLKVLSGRPGIGSKEMRGVARAAGLGGIERLSGALHLLEQGFAGHRLVDRGSGQPGAAKAWHLELVEGDRYDS